MARKKSLKEALKAYTLSNACANFDENIAETLQASNVPILISFWMIRG